MDNVFFKKNVASTSEILSTKKDLNNEKISKKKVVKEVKVKKVYVKKEKKNICVAKNNVVEEERSLVFESNLEIPTKSPINITKLNDLQCKKNYITEIVPSKKQNRNKISMTKLKFLD
jgi:FlaA1/EpsC-like NDP-sugar epimerase